jgi:hypothetical protein
MQPARAALCDLEERILRDELAVTPVLSRIAASGPHRRPRRPSSGRGVPWQPSPLVGRDDDLAVPRECAGPGSVVSLVGPGSVGTTRLGLQVAYQAAE